MRWVVGDVQGCARELERLLETIRFDSARDELWCLGDLVNRGPDSLAALELWLATGGRGILGNHDVYALLARSGRLKRREDTLDELFRDERADELLARLRALPVLVHLPAPHAGAEAVWLVHAGLHPTWRDLEGIAASLNATPHDDDWLSSEGVGVVTRIRCCTASGERSRFTGPPADCPAPFRPWDDFYEGRTRVVFGHWARRGLDRRPRTLCLDSGCVYGGSLSAWCQDEDRLVQVPALARPAR